MIQLNLGARWRSTDATAHAGPLIAAIDFSFLIIVLPTVVSFSQRECDKSESNAYVRHGAC